MPKPSLLLHLEQLSVTLLQLIACVANVSQHIILFYLFDCAHLIHNVIDCVVRRHWDSHVSYQIRLKIVLLCFLLLMPPHFSCDSEIVADPITCVRAG